MVMTFVLTPWSHYNIVTEPCARFLVSLMEDLSIDFPSHMIKSMIDCYRDTATRDKIIFPSAITCILSHVHITIPLSSHFYVMGAINKESIQRSDAQLAAKWPYVESTSIDAAPALRPSSSSAHFSSSFGAEVSLVAIMNQLQLIRADFGTRLNHLSDEICQMNTRIGRFVCCQSHLGGFAPPSLELAESSSNGRDNDDDDASCS